ncbi:MAG: ribokinase [Burkholderiales bacterium PBB4]|nr:MAG: ribokinase [Burkholderiales bacterium PBB4]
MILVAGSANLDFVVRANHIPQPGETVLGRDFKTFPGGKGANQAVAAARAGGVLTHLLAGLGNDAFATPIEASLQDAGVVLQAVRVSHEPTGTAFICVSDDAENAITVAPGANGALTPEHLPHLQGFTHLLLQLETPVESVTAYAQAARAQGVCVVLNAAPAQALPEALLAAIDILVVNEGELATVAQHDGSIAECLTKIKVPTVVVTLGHHGACAHAQSSWVLQPAFAITPVDTTAAGDTFCGALVAALSKGQSMAQALRKASAAGALACTQLGAQSSIPAAAAVAEFLAQQAPHSAHALGQLRQFCGLPE